MEGDAMNHDDDLFKRWDTTEEDDLYGLSDEDSSFDLGGSGWTLNDAHAADPALDLHDQPDVDLGAFFDDLDAPGEPAPFVPTPFVPADASPEPAFELDEGALTQARESARPTGSVVDIELAPDSMRPRAPPTPADLYGASRGPQRVRSSVGRGPQHEGDGCIADLIAAPLSVLKNDGFIMVGFATVVLVFALFAGSSRGLLALFIAVGSYGFFFSYLMRVASESAAGAHALPEFSEYGSIWHDGVVPIFQITALTLGYCAITIGVAQITRHPLALIAASILALALYPMGFLNLSMRGSVWAIRPDWQLHALSRAPADYAAAATFFILGVGLLALVTRGMFSSIDLLQVGSIELLVRLLVPTVLFVYGAIVNAHVIGRFFYYNEHELDFEI